MHLSTKGSKSTMKGTICHLTLLVCCGLLHSVALANSYENSIYSADVHPLQQRFTDLHQVPSTPLHTHVRARIVTPDLDLDTDAVMGAALDDVSVWKRKNRDGFEVNSRNRELGRFHHSEDTLRLNLASSSWRREESSEFEPPIHNIRPREAYFLECPTTSATPISSSASDHLPIGNALKSKYLKTGTTIVGVQTRTHIIIAADTRATEGTVVADTRCDKVHQLASNVWCCGAGTSADLDALTRKMRYTFLLRSKIQDSIGNGVLIEEDQEEEGMNDMDDKEDRYRSQEERNINQTLGKVSISSICTMIREELYKNGGGIGANLVLGGVDAHSNEPILTAIHPHGSIDRVPYTALGSGGLAAMGILESRYHPEIPLEEAINLVQDAVHAGIKNDLGSGSQVDICVISKTGVTHKRGVVPEEALRLSRGDEKMENELFQRHTSGHEVLSMGGVNGFGSLPYKIMRRKMILVDEQLVRRERESWLRGIIGTGQL